MRNAELDEDGNVKPQLLGTAIAGGLRMRAGGAEDRLNSCGGAEDSGMMAMIWAVSEEKRWGALLVLACGLDLLGSTVVAIIAFRYAYRNVGISLYCLALQSISHLLSSLLLIFRLFGDLQPPWEQEWGNNSAVSEECLLLERRREDLVREKSCSVVMAIVMWVGSSALLFKAVRKLTLWDEWYIDHAEMDREVAGVTSILAWSCSAAYLLHAAIRAAGARKLAHRVFWHGFAVSLVSVLFLLVLAVAASFEQELIWKAEPCAALVLALLSFAEGARMLYMHSDEIASQLPPSV